MSPEPPPVDDGDHGAAPLGRARPAGDALGAWLDEVLGGVDPALVAAWAADRLAGDDPAGWVEAAVGPRLESLGASWERLGTAVARATGALDASAVWAGDGATSSQAWLLHHLGVDAGTAADLVAAGRVVSAHPTVADALADGSLSLSKAVLLGRARAERRRSLFERDEHLLTEHARRLSPRQLRLVLRRWSCLADDDAATDDAERSEDRRHLHLSATTGGWSLRGWLAPDAGAALASALASVAGPPDPEPLRHERTAAQRRADALADLARHHLAAAGSSRGAPPVTVECVVDLSVLGRPDGLPDDLGRSVADLVGFGPIARRDVERLLCDSWVGRIVSQGRAAVLDVGRRTPTFTRSQRRAVARRDEHCVYPGCDRPHHWCDVHHLLPWEQGGVTSVDNGCLLCRRHHTRLHHRGEQLERRPDGSYRLTAPARAGPAAPARE